MSSRLLSISAALPCLVSLLILAGCAGKRQPTEALAPVSIGPYPAFSGRLIVIEPTKRWQVLIKWRADEPEQGWLRITHGATGTVVEFRWRKQQMQIRDNQHPGWRVIGQQQLSEHGIVLPPAQLAGILLGRMPAHFSRKNSDTWESTQSGSLIRLQWQEDAQRLAMTDMKHGRKATLIIDQ